MNIFGKIENIIAKIQIEILLIIVFILGAIGHTIPITKDIFILFTPLILLLSAIFLIIRLKIHPTIIAIIIMIAVLGYVLEVIGVSTGYPFGEYKYGNILGYKILDVPLVIALNWAMVITSSYIFTQQFIIKINKNFLLITPLLTALVATIFDYIMEPVAIYLNYWRWADIKVPTENYITWFVFSFISSVFIYITTKGSIFRNHKAALSYLIAQLIFFTILNIYIL